MKPMFAKIQALLLQKHSLAIPDDLSGRELSDMDGGLGTNEELGAIHGKEGASTVSYYDNYPGL